MNLATIEISSEEAVERLAEYEKALHTERTSEDDAIAQAYRAAKRGMPIIMLTQAIALGGFFDTGHPRLAVVRATAKQCWVRFGSGRDLLYSDDEWCRNQGALVNTHTVRVPRVLPERHPYFRTAGTMVPIIPLRFRPKRNRLHLYHVLWEVEAWNLTPPRDPALLRHVRGDVWAVVAQWDLTPLEQAVLRGTRG